MPTRIYAGVMGTVPEGFAMTFRPASHITRSLTLGNTKERPGQGWCSGVGHIADARRGLLQLLVVGPGQGTGGVGRREVNALRGDDGHSHVGEWRNSVIIFTAPPRPSNCHLTGQSAPGTFTASNTERLSSGDPLTNGPNRFWAY